MRAGSLIRNERLNRKISQKCFASKIGISQQYLNDIEHNSKRFPANDIIVNKIVKELNLNKNYLLYLEGRFPDHVNRTLTLDKFELAIAAFISAGNN